MTTTLGRVLVTGGSGFVGANLVSTLLDRGHEVRSFDRAPSPLPTHPRLEVLEGDITDPEVVARAVDGIDTVIHTAAKGQERHETGGGETTNRHSLQSRRDGGGGRRAPWAAQRLMRPSA